MAFRGLLAALIGGFVVTAAAASSGTSNGVLSWRHEARTDALTGKTIYKELAETRYSDGFNIIAMAQYIGPIWVELDFYTFRNDNPVRMNTDSFNESVRIVFDQADAVSYLGHHDKVNEIGINFMAGHEVGTWNSLPELERAKSARIELTMGDSTTRIVQISPQDSSLRSFMTSCTKPTP